VKGAGDLATGAALSLCRAGFRVLMTELAEPIAIRLSVSFAQAIYAGSHVVEGIGAERCARDGWEAVLAAGAVAVVVDPEARVLNECSPVVVVDAVMAKRNTGTARREGSVVIGLGPGFSAGDDVDAVVETMRGHELGRVVRKGSARQNTGIPGEVGGRTADRVLRAPADGRVIHERRIGDVVEEGAVVARVGGAAVRAAFDGCVRGLIHEGIEVTRGMKIGDVDPRADARFVDIVSDKARAVGRAVLEAALEIGRERGLLSVGALNPEGL